MELQYCVNTWFQELEISVFFLIVDAFFYDQV